MLKISVIIPTCRDRPLARCLNRLAPGQQTLDSSQYEVIVSDDASEATAQELIARQYPWAKWVPGPRKGPAANRNNGSQLARGQWLVFTDDDCIPAPTWLASYLDAGASDVAVLEGKTTCQDGLATPMFDAPINLDGGRLWSCNFMIRADLFRELRGFDESFPMPSCEDVELKGRILRRGHKVCFVPAAVVDHPPRRRPNGWRLGMMWESRVNLWYKEGNCGSVWSWLPMHLLKYRIPRILDYPIRWYTVSAICSLAIEFLCVVIHLSEWQKRHRPARHCR